MSSLDFFELASRQAFLAKGSCKPNPAVGAVFVKGGRVVGVGRTGPYGGDHAEVNAIRSANPQSDLKGATLYVTLTPCGHHGKTPPCSEAIVRCGIGRVVVANRDPSPVAEAAKTEALFRSKGIACDYGFPKPWARRLFELNSDFFFRAMFHRPLITLKMALTMDGKMATHTGDSKWISCEASRRDAHKTRALVDAILVGAGTINADKPQLTCRWRPKNSPPAKHPLRVVVCTNNTPLDLAPGESVFSKEAKTIFLIHEAAKALQEQLEEQGAEVALYNKKPYSDSVVEALASNYNLNSLLVEGGSKTYAGFLEAGLADQIRVYHSMSKVLGDGNNALSPFESSARKSFINDAIGFVPASLRRLGEDVVVVARSMGYARAREQMKSAVLIG